MEESKVSALQGKENADYVRTQIPKGRWADTWDVFKSNFGKIVIINLLTAVFFVPIVALLIIRTTYVNQMGLLYPFSSNVGIYPLSPSTVGMQESIILSADLLFYSLVVAAGLIASVGVSGASYSLKKLLITHGEFTVKSFFRGVKTCYFNTVLAVTLFMLFFFASIAISDWADLQIVNGAGAAGPITAKVFIIIATVLVGIIAMWLLAVGVSYKVGILQLFKNSFILLIGTIFQTLFMLGFSFIPVWLLLIGRSVAFFQVIAYIFLIVMGFSTTLLCWFAYTQWVFDMFITPVIKSEKEAARAKMTPKQLEEEKEREEKDVARELLAAGRSELIGRPMKPIEATEGVRCVGTVYGRADLSRTAGERKQIEEGVALYYEQHKNDTRFVEYEKLFAEREKALETPTDKKGKKKRISSDNLLK